ncbi:hypothetical protein [Nocardioides sp. NPDC006273]|uniref:hypothetical protein n=1 Tax=Nocardioides sp. NPDC006273 TaxID=3155598 RepID=UPI0033BDE92D
MTNEALGRRRSSWTTSEVVVLLDVAAKVLLLLSIVRVGLDPTWGNLEGKAPIARAVTYPLLAFAIPLVWLARRHQGAYPWTADLLITLVCFNDILGNRLDLYDAIVWFDDASHFFATGQLSAAAVLLTLHRGTFGQVLERAVAVGMTIALAWEVFEYFSFVTTSSELQWAYRDTIGDLTLGWLGSVAAAAVIAAYWHFTESPSGAIREAVRGERSGTAY